MTVHDCAHFIAVGYMHYTLRDMARQPFPV
jgi:hypothetical protein